MAVDCGKFTIQNVSTNNNTAYGVEVVKAYNEDDYVIDKVWAKNNGMYGLRVGNTKNATVANCFLDGNVLGGVLVENSKNVVIDKMIIKDTPIGIYEDVSSLDNDYHNCKFTNIQTEYDLNGSNSSVEGSLPRYIEFSVPDKAKKISSQVPQTLTKFNITSEYKIPILDDEGDITTYKDKYNVSGTYDKITIWTGNLVKQVDGYYCLDTWFSDFDSTANPRCNYLTFHTDKDFTYIITCKAKGYVNFAQRDPTTGETIKRVNNAYMNNWQEFTFSVYGTGADVYITLAGYYLELGRGYCKDIQIYRMVRNNVLLTSNCGDIETYHEYYSSANSKDYMNVWASGLVKQIDGYYCLDGYSSDYVSLASSNCNYLEFYTNIGYVYIVTCKVKGYVNFTQRNSAGEVVTTTGDVNAGSIWLDKTFTLDGADDTMYIFMETGYLVYDRGYYRDIAITKVKKSSYPVLGDYGSVSKYASEYNLAGMHNNCIYIWQDAMIKQVDDDYCIDGNYSDFTSVTNTGSNYITFDMDTNYIYVVTMKGKGQVSFHQFNKDTSTLLKTSGDIQVATPWSKQSFVLDSTVTKGFVCLRAGYLTPNQGFYKDIVVNMIEKPAVSGYTDAQVIAALGSSIGEIIKISGSVNYHDDFNFTDACTLKVSGSIESTISIPAMNYFETEGVYDSIEYPNTYNKCTSSIDLTGSAFNSLDTSLANVDVVVIPTSNFASVRSFPNSLGTTVVIPNYKLAGTTIDSTNNIGCYYERTDGIGLIVAKGAYETINAVQLALGTITAYYILSAVSTTTISGLPLILKGNDILQIETDGITPSAIGTIPSNVAGANYYNLTLLRKLAGM